MEDFDGCAWLSLCASLCPEEEEEEEEEAHLAREDDIPPLGSK